MALQALALQALALQALSLQVLVLQALVLQALVLQAVARGRDLLSNVGGTEDADDKYTFLNKKCVCVWGGGYICHV